MLFIFRSRDQIKINSGILVVSHDALGRSKEIGGTIYTNTRRVPTVPRYIDHR